MRTNLIEGCIAQALTSRIRQREVEYNSCEERRVLCNRAARIMRRLGIPAVAEQHDTGRRDVVCSVTLNGHTECLFIGVFYPDNHVAVLAPTLTTRGTGWVAVSKDLRTLPTVIKHELTRFAAETLIYPKRR